MRTIDQQSEHRFSLVIATVMRVMKIDHCIIASSGDSGLTPSFCQQQHSGHSSLHCIDRPCFLNDSLLFTETCACFPGKVSLTPMTIGELWKEEEESTRQLFKQFKDLAESCGVSLTRINDSDSRPGSLWKTL